jgi:hypothetical protein
MKTLNETGAGIPAVHTVTLKKGWGYWDVTHYPYGGSFHRADKDMTGKVVNGPANLYGNGMEYAVVLEDGKSAIIPARGILKD